MSYCLRFLVICSLVLGVVYSLDYMVDAYGRSGNGRVVNNREEDIRVTWSYRKMLGSEFERSTNMNYEDVRRNYTDIAGEERVLSGRTRVYQIPVGACLIVHTDYFKEEEGTKSNRSRNIFPGFTPLLINQNICRVRALRECKQ